MSPEKKTSSILLTVLPLIILFTVNVFAVDRTMGVLTNDMTGWPGYTLYTPADSGLTYLIDQYGRIVHSWESQYKAWRTIYLLENGNLVRTKVHAANVYGIEIQTWEGEIIWDFVYTGEFYFPHHDIEPMPNGNILMIVRDRIPSRDFIARGRDPQTVGSSYIAPEKIIEVKPTGLNTAEIVWEWRAYDHMVQDFDPDKPNYGNVSDHSELIDINYTPDITEDWLHFNSVDYNEELDQILISARKISEIWIIDHSTSTMQAAGHFGGRYGKGGDILYRWGNPESYKAKFNSERKLFFPHDAKWVEKGMPGEGNITIFNNGPRDDGKYSSADEISPPIREDGSYGKPYLYDSFEPRGYVWQYYGNPPLSMYSAHFGGVQRLPNGNTLICEAYKSHLIEVKPDSTIVWEYKSPYLTLGGFAEQGVSSGTSYLFRAHRYDLDYPAFEGRDLNPEGYPEINPVRVESTINFPEAPYDFEQTAVTSKILDESEILSADLYVYFGTDSLIITMNDSGQNGDKAAGDSVYTALIPALPGQSKADYFIKITDGSGGIFFDPPFASKNYYFEFKIISGTPENITISRDQDSVGLIWDQVEGISEYKVYSSDHPFSGFTEDVFGFFDGNSWTTGAGNDKRFYYVVAVKK